MGKARTSAEPVRLSATSNLHVPSSMPGKEKERDRRTGDGPRKWIEKRWARRGRTYNTSLFYKATSSNMGICGSNNRDNYTPSYLHVALSDSNYKACYKQMVDKRDTEHRNY